MATFTHNLGMLSLWSSHLINHQWVYVHELLLCPIILGDSHSWSWSWSYNSFLKTSSNDDAHWIFSPNRRLVEKRYYWDEINLMIIIFSWKGDCSPRIEWISKPTYSSRNNLKLIFSFDELVEVEWNFGLSLIKTVCKSIISYWFLDSCNTTDVVFS